MNYEFIIKSAVILALLYSLFFFFLRKETFHRFNRVCLLFMLVASLLLPMVHITLSHPSAVNEAVVASTTYITTLPAIVVTPEAHTPTLTWNGVIVCIYWIGLSMMLLYLALQIVQTYLLIKGGLRHTDKFGNAVILKDDVKSPFSIFHYIVMSVEDYEKHRQNILTHEQEHVRMRHSYDLLLLQVVKILQWFNPFVWFLENDMKALHEYQADEAVINKGIDAKQYQQLLVVKAVGNRLQPFANNLRRGSLKKRIIMMYQKKSNRWMMLKALFIIPMTCFAIYAFATPESKVVKKLKTKVAAVEQTFQEIAAPAEEQTVEQPVPVVEELIAEPATPVVEQAVEPAVAEEPVEAEQEASAEATSDSIYGVVEKLAQFQDGEAAMYQFLAQNMKYPKIAQECSVQGRVTVSFVVEKNGTLSEVIIARNTADTKQEVRDIEGEDANITVTSYIKKDGDTQYLSRAEYNTARKALEEEAIRVVNLTSGKWNAAEDKGKKVRCKYLLPISFRLR
ncbi:MAG: energy transducer TonB [Bacteroidaceae bacterium]|nr:energy transducer TonB [Bacteroidaceae bacterium]